MSVGWCFLHLAHVEYLDTVPSQSNFPANLAAGLYLPWKAREEGLGCVGCSLDLSRPGAVPSLFNTVSSASSSCISYDASR